MIWGQFPEDFTIDLNLFCPCGILQNTNIMLSARGLLPTSFHMENISLLGHAHLKFELWFMESRPLCCAGNRNWSVSGVALRRGRRRVEAVASERVIVGSRSVSLRRPHDLLSSDGHGSVRAPAVCVSLSKSELRLAADGAKRSRRPVPGSAIEQPPAARRQRPPARLHLRLARLAAGAEASPQGRRPSCAGRAAGGQGGR